MARKTNATTTATKATESKNKGKKAAASQSPAPKTEKKARVMTAYHKSIMAALNEIANTDKAFALKWNSGACKKDIFAVEKYLYEYHRAEAKKNGNVFCSDNEADHKLAYKYIMDDSIKVPTASSSNKKPSAPDVVEDEEDAEDDTIVNEEVVAAPRRAPKPKQTPKQKQQPADKDLFDFDLF